MTLQFIDQGAVGMGPSESDRRIIRSHVMRGKNAGRPRPSTRKQSTIVHVKRVWTAPGILGSGYSKPGRQLLWNDLCFTSFPQQLDSESTKLMHRCTYSVLFPIPARLPSSSLTHFSQGSLTLAMRCFRPNSARNSTSSSRFGLIMSWQMKHVSNVSTCHVHSPTLIPYPPDFHSTLAISASYVDFFERKPGISSKTLYHISQAYALVNLKLSGPESISDSAIAAVVTLAIYQQIHHLHSTGLIHLNGLYRMIQLRGGIARLMKENRALALKPLRYVYMLAFAALFFSSWSF